MGKDNETEDIYISSAIKNKEILPLVPTQMHLEGIILSKISQGEKDKYSRLLTALTSLPLPLLTLFNFSSVESKKTEFIHKELTGGC